ncbi:MAG TPA: trigger factor [Chitinophagales bacterium]|nr:trigger factor [Chitinophagales bacterium]HMU98627.1 trigger factor [Chitinophagales bacterium]HMV02436.1 trigger factor [Chitinophagales bacterium]HMW93611.1 trigger factor [Chitinophagales bacterium]HMY41638.1 trigger factor [Chitinophagales bacterium]
MNITKTNTDNVNAVLTVNIQKEDYMPQVDKMLQDYRKKVSIKGFRVGHVPAGLVKKMYGNAILFDEVNKLTSEALNKYILDEKLDILGQPLPKADNNQVVIDINQPADITFEFEIGMVPEFSIPELSSIQVNAKKITVTDNDIDKEVNDISLRYGDAEEITDTIQEKDIITFELKELEGKAIKEGGIQNTTVLNEDMIVDKKVRKALTKQKVGDSFTANPFTLVDRDSEQVAKNILGIKENIPTILPENFQFTITKVTRLKQSAIDQSLFDKVYGEGNVTSEEDFRNKIRAEIENYTEQSYQNSAKENIYKELMDKIQLDFPEAFLKKFIKNTNEKPVSDEQIDLEYPGFIKGMSWNIISTRIAKDNDIKVEMDDVKAFSKEQIKRQFAMYGGGGLDDATLDMLNDNMLKKEDHVRKSFDAALEQKLFDLLISKVKISEEVVTFEDYVNQTK